ncbi:MAG: hypothetical protein U0003_00740 [Vampirovibrionales bacterium]
MIRLDSSSRMAATSLSPKFGAFVLLNMESMPKATTITDQFNYRSRVLAQLLPEKRYGVESLNGQCWVSSEDGRQTLLAVNERGGPQDADWLRQFLIRMEKGSLCRYLGRVFYQWPLHPSEPALMDWVINWYRENAEQYPEQWTNHRWQSVSTIEAIQQLPLA